MKSNAPRHVAVIMDGNGRWAQKRLLPRKAGHKEGVKTLMKIARHAFNRGIEYLTIYAFSTENKNRPKDEIDGLINLIREYFKNVFGEFIENGIKIRVLGDVSYFPQDVIDIVKKVEKDSEKGQNGTLSIALNYGARAEILRAITLLKNSGEDITEENFEKYLYTASYPEPDIILRTGGEKRLSNFLLYQSAYSELFYTDTLWPDYSEKEFDEMINAFKGRSRRYGKVE